MIKRLLKKLKCHLVYDHGRQTMLRRSSRYLRIGYYYGVAIWQLILRIGKNTLSLPLPILRRIGDFFVAYWFNFKKRLEGKFRELRSILDEARIFSVIFAEIVPLLEKEGPQAVAMRLKKHKLFLLFPSTRFLKALYQYAVTLEAGNLQLIQRGGEKETIIIHFCCWGKRYADKAISYLLPSLLSENNIPLLARQHRIVLLIHCDRLTRKMITCSPSYPLLIQHATVTFCMLSSKVIKRYWTCIKKKVSVSVFPTIRYLLLGVCQTHALKIAVQNHAYISFLMPDVILSESFMSYAWTKLSRKKMVLTTTYRTHHPSIYPDLKKYYMPAHEGGALTIAAPELVVLQIKHMHPNEHKRIVSTDTQNFLPMARLLFKDEHGFILRCFHYHAVIINCKELMKAVHLDYLPIDNTALNSILDASVPYSDQAWVCENACEMAIMELSDDNSESDVVVNTRVLSYPELVTQVRDLIRGAPNVYDTPFNRFLMSYRHRLTVTKEMPHGNSDYIDDTAFFDEIYTSLES